MSSFRKMKRSSQVRGRGAMEDKALCMEMNPVTSPCQTVKLQES